VDAAELIRAKALTIGFDAVGFARASLNAQTRERLRNFLAEGRHGSMGWLEERSAQRESPDALWPEAVSAISLGVSYAPDADPVAHLAEPSVGGISVYARHRDYHDLVKGMLKHLAQFIASRFGADVKVFVDTAPLLEKPLAAQAGIGWQGKHTNLVSRAHGSWLFLGEVLTTLDLAPSGAHADRCGTCTRCQTACPTNAFPAPYQLDARRCISYLTIEHDGPIPLEFRAAMGNRIYGCDDCLAACPWNRFAQATAHAKLQARPDLIAPSLAELARLDDAGFRALFSGSPIKRIGWRRFLRNVLIAIGNSADKKLLPYAEAQRGSDDATLAETAAWAVERLT
jgi:epoxyqueuosine reductase